VGFLLYKQNVSGGRMSLQQKSKSIINDAIIKDIRDAVEELSFGTVTLTVHNNKITQIEITKKKRFDEVWKIEGGGGI
jgi:hypothetical protein